MKLGSYRKAKLIFTVRSKNQFYSFLIFIMYSDNIQCLDSKYQSSCVFSFPNDIIGKQKF